MSDVKINMKVLVVNCSAPSYNLGAAKMADGYRSEGHDVTESAGDPGMFCHGYDVVALSVIFSWHAPIALSIAQRVKDSSEVTCGGPGMFALGKWWNEQTGLVASIGLDQRFDRQWPLSDDVCRARGARSGGAGASSCAFAELKPARQPIRATPAAEADSYCRLSFDSPRRSATRREIASGLA